MEFAIDDVSEGGMTLIPDDSVTGWDWYTIFSQAGLDDKEHVINITVTQASDDYPFFLDAFSFRPSTVQKVLSTTNTSSSSSSTSSSTGSPSPTGAAVTAKTPVGAIVGGVVGGVLGLLALIAAGVGFWYWRRRRGRHRYVYVVDKDGDDCEPSLHPTCSTMLTPGCAGKEKRVHLRPISLSSIEKLRLDEDDDHPETTPTPPTSGTTRVDTPGSPTRSTRTTSMRSTHSRRTQDIPSPTESTRMALQHADSLPSPSWTRTETASVISPGRERGAFGSFGQEGVWEAAAPTVEMRAVDAWLAATHRRQEERRRSQSTYAPRLSIVSASSVGTRPDTGSVAPRQLSIDTDAEPTSRPPAAQRDSVLDDPQGSPADRPQEVGASEPVAAPQRDSVLGNPYSPPAHTASATVTRSPMAEDHTDIL